METHEAPPVAEPLPSPAPRYDILLWKNKVWEAKVSNSGDLAIIANTFHKLREQIPEARVHVLSDDPEYVSARYGVVAHPVALLSRPLELARLIRKMDLVILGGGTVLQDDYFMGIIPINLSVPLLARAFGKRAVCNAIGVGSNEEISRLGKLFCRLALPLFESISVRDPESRDMLLPWVGTRTPVHLTADIAVDFEPADFSKLEPGLRQDGIDLSEGETVIIGARKTFHHDKTPLYFIPSSLRQRLGLQSREGQARVRTFERTLAALCDHIVNEHGAKVLLAPFYGSGGGVDSGDARTPRRLFSSGDNAFAQRVVALTKSPERVRVLNKNYRPEELLAIIERCQAMVGVQYHSVVFASSRNVPVMGIHYVSKVERYMKQLGQQDFIVPAGASLETYRERFDTLWANRARIADELRSANTRLKPLADENIRIIRRLLVR